MTQISPYDVHDALHDAAETVINAYCLGCSCPRCCGDIFSDYCPFSYVTRRIEQICQNAAGNIVNLLREEI